MSTGQQGQTSARNCVACGRSIAWDANVCPFCGHDFRPAMSGSTSGQALDKRFKGSLLVLIILLVVCWPAAIIYFFMKRD